MGAEGHTGGGKGERGEGLESKGAIKGGGGERIGRKKMKREWGRNEEE